VRRGGISNPDRLVTVGACGLRFFEYMYGVEEQVTLRSIAVEGLHVEHVSKAAKPLYHPSTGVYGFLHLRGDGHRFIVRDPGGRYLPRTVEASVAESVTKWHKRLKGGVSADPPEYTELVQDLALFPRPGAMVAPSHTALYGTAYDKHGRRAPFARVLVADPAGQERPVLAYADRHGDWIVYLREAQVSVGMNSGTTDDKSSRTVAMWMLKEARQDRLSDPLRVFPHNFERLSHSATDDADKIETHYETIDSWTVEVTVGERNDFEQLK
jgi:hypothetical protein